MGSCLMRVEKCEKGHICCDECEKVYDCPRSCGKVIRYYEFDNYDLESEKKDCYEEDMQ
ncbi:MAG: hypothetical protein N4A64_11215 [Marinisporobacter sp.]|nr:hypothetical protein [Marinisporobacter sp.]